METLRMLWQDDQGQDITEYALLMVLIALVAIASIKGLTSAITNIFGNAASALSTSVGGATN